MTTRLPGRFGAVPREIFERPEPPPEAMRQGRDIADIDGILRAHFEPADEDTPRTVVVSGSCVIHYDRNDMNRKLSPDALVALDVDAESVWYEDRYLLWEVGKPPDFVLEIASRTTAREDLEVKPGIYEAMGVTEYWRFDPSGGNFYGYHLAGDRLVNGKYEPLPIEQEPDGSIRGYSPALDLFLYPGDYRLRLYDPKTGEFMLNTVEERTLRQEERALRREERALREEEQARREEEQVRRLAEQARREEAEAALDAERAALRAAEERIRALEARLGNGSPDTD